MDYCEQAFNEFCDRHWPCNFRRSDTLCVNVAVGHEKGHQDHTGRLFSSGAYVPSYNFKKDFNSWIQLLQHHLNDMQKSKNKAALGRSESADVEFTFNLHRINLQKFYREIGSAKRFKSHFTCFCCLRGGPIHPLLCGHILCNACVRLFGKSKGKDFIEMAECPLEGRESYWHQPCVIKFMPRLAGARVLCLDGYVCIGEVLILLIVSGVAYEELLNLKFSRRFKNTSHTEFP